MIFLLCGLCPHRRFRGGLYLGEFEMNEQYELLESGQAIDKETGEVFTPEYPRDLSDKELKAMFALEEAYADAEEKEHNRIMLIGKIIGFAFLVIIIISLFL